MALRLGDIMEELSQHDYYTHDGQDAVPAWVRAHYILDQQMIQQRAGEGGTPQSAVRARATALVQVFQSSIPHRRPEGAVGI